MHLVEGLVEVVEAHGVGDERGEIYLAFHCVLHHAGKLSAALDPAESRALPGATGDQLERARRNFLACTSHADDDRLAPATMCRSEEHTSELQSLMRISYAVFCLKTKKQQSKYTQSEPKHKISKTNREPQIT